VIRVAPTGKATGVPEFVADFARFAAWLTGNCRIRRKMGGVEFFGHLVRRWVCALG
jgi:hypothetical protein